MSGAKPKYKVPSMKEIEAVPWNGFNVVSTFSGGGGSCLGYEMAGYHVLYANEFVEEAQNTYRANHKNTILDTRDIRTVSASDILRTINMKPGEVDLFDGSPPCCAFSLNGSREKGWNQERAYSDGKVQQIENLFFEYIRLLNGIQPKTFVAENVSGLVYGSAIGYFKDFIIEMQKCGYKVKARLLNSMWLGVPERRQRIIFVGVRNDIGIEPVHPEPLPYFYNIGDAFENLPKQNEVEAAEIQERFSKLKAYRVLKRLPKNPKHSVSAAKVMNGSWFNLRRESFNDPCATICTQWNAAPCHPVEDRPFTISELKRISSVPDDFVLTGTFSQQYERIGRMVPPIMMMRVAKTIQTEILDKTK